MRPVIGITLGDPCGIGPEILAKVFSRREVYKRCRPLAVGSAKVLAQAARIAGADILVRPVKSVGEALFEPGTADILDMDIVDMDTLRLGQLQAQGGEAAFQAVRMVIELAMAGQIDATVTCPLNKEALHLAGHPYSGHTEIYAELTGTKDYSMMLAEGSLRVVHVSTHVSLREACDRCKRARVLEVIRLADRACRELGIAAPRIGVAGLNPHAGEHGLFGLEEIEEIGPAIADARKEGIDAEGPVPPDTLFPKARGGLYDIVVAQYHDQGHIPLKMAGFQYDGVSGKWQSVSGINVTLGLPIIRSSVDHGTAFDQAGMGTANEDSLRNAVDYAVLMASSKR